MEIIPFAVRGNNRSRSRSTLLDTETQSNITTLSDKDGVATKFIVKQLNKAERQKSRKDSKRLFEKKLKECGFHNEANLLNRCWQNCVALVCDNGHAFRPIPDFRCGLVFCPDCWLTKSERELHRTLPKLLQARKNDPSLKLVLMTLTLKGIKDRDLKTGVELLKSYFRKLRRRSLMSDCAGGYVRIENTRTENGWNTHLHCLMLVKKRIAETELSREWLDITGDSYKVDLRNVSDNTDSIIQTLIYPFKPADMQKLDKPQIEEMLAMKGERLGFSFGVLFGTKTDAGITSEGQDAYDEFIAETKGLKIGDPCPICKTKLDLVDFSAEGYLGFVRSVSRPPTQGGIRCRDS